MDNLLKTLKDKWYIVLAVVGGVIFYFVSKKKK